MKPEPNETETPQPVALQPAVSPLAWLEWSLHRLEHLLFIWDNPKSVQAAFGPQETMDCLRENLPKLREYLNRANKRTEPRA